MMERTLAPDDPRIAEVLFNLSAVVGGQRGRLGETENILHRCLEAQRRLHGVGGYNAVVFSLFGTMRIVVCLCGVCCFFSCKVVAVLSTRPFRPLCTTSAMVSATYDTRGFVEA